MAASEALGDVRRASVTKLAGATLGVHLRDDNEHGVMVDRISASTSDLMWLDSELKKGDVILSVNGASAIKAEDVARIIGAAEVLRFDVRSSALAARGSSTAMPRLISVLGLALLVTSVAALCSRSPTSREKQRLDFGRGSEAEGKALMYAINATLERRDKSRIKRAQRKAAPTLSPCAASSSLAPLAEALRDVRAANISGGPNVCVLNHLPLSMLELLLCALPGLTLHSFTSSGREELTRRVPRRTLRFTNHHTELFGLFDGTGELSRGLEASCDVIVINAGVGTPDARQGVLHSLPLALRLLRSGVNAMLIGGPPCHSKPHNASVRGNGEYRVDGLCFKVQVPMGGRQKCRRRDCVVRDACSMPASCWRDTVNDLSSGGWVHAHTCVEHTTGRHRSQWCAARVSLESACSRQTPLLDGLVPSVVSWKAPKSWRRRQWRTTTNESISAAQLVLRQLRYLTIVPGTPGASTADRGVCMIFKDALCAWSPSCIELMLTRLATMLTRHCHV